MKQLRNREIARLTFRSRESEREWAINLTFSSKGWSVRKEENSSNKMRWIVKLKLCFTDSRTKTSNGKMALLIIVAGFMMYLNWSNHSLGMSCPANITEDDFLFCLQDGRNVITKSSVRKIGKPLTRKVFLTIGIPTVKRIFKNKTASYLVETLHSLLDKNNIPEGELGEILIIVFLADTEQSAREEVKEILRSNFGQYLDMNLIHVIEAPSSFFPQLTGLKQTHKDGPERMYWRSKQSMDYVFMFYYSHGLSQYYLHLEDDVAAEPNYMAQIRDFINLKGNTRWDILAFSKWGFIGKLIHNKDLRKFGRFTTMFYNEMPVDWMLLLYMELQTGKNILNDETNEYTWKNELFHHIGDQSSSLGT